MSINIFQHGETFSSSCHEGPGVVLHDVPILLAEGDMARKEGLSPIQSLWFIINKVLIKLPSSGSEKTRFKTAQTSGRVSDMVTTQFFIRFNPVSESFDSTHNDLTRIDSNLLTTQNEIVKFDSNRLTTQKVSRLFRFKPTHD